MTMSEWFDQTSTSLNACSLETFVPILDSDDDGKVSAFFLPLVIGCYQLEEKTCITASADSTDDASSLVGQPSSSCRQGELQLYMISSPASSSLPASSLHENNNNGTLRFRDSVCIVNMESGVLDGKWRRRRKRRCITQCMSTDDDSYYQTMPIFASACASGKIHLHSLEKKHNDSSWTLLHLASSSSEAEKHSITNNEELSSLCLSLAWNDFIDYNNGDDSRNDQCHDQIVSSYSNGTLALHTIHPNSSNNSVGYCSIEETHKWKAHDMFGCPAEVWTCSFLRGNTNVVLSGADDCKLKLWDIRNTQRETYTIGTSEFDAGVTAISPHPGRDHIFAVGSYDEFVRVYDYRKLDQPILKFAVGGGVWRIKWHPSCWDDNYEQPPSSERNHVKKGRLLIAAMHGGCRVIDIPRLENFNYDCEYDGSSSVDDIKVMSEFTAHKSMAYGADWVCFGFSVHDAAASCSFYDQKAFLWDPNK
jgi:diphthamide biosynthesis protein 7